MQAVPLSAAIIDLSGAPVPFARVTLRKRQWRFVEGIGVPPITTLAEADGGGVVRVELVPGTYVCTITGPCGRHERAFLTEAPGDWLQHAV